MKSTKRIMLTVAYDGTNYCGWQIQPNGITIEGVLNEKLSELLVRNFQQEILSLRDVHCRQLSLAF